MWHPQKVKKVHEEGNGLVALAIDRDKGSQYALKWALENLLSKGHTVILIHVLKSSSAVHHEHFLHETHGEELEKLTHDLFLPFRCYCTRKDVQCIEIVLEDHDVVKALTDYVYSAAIENLLLGASRHGLMRKFKMDVPSTVSRAAPDFCTVYIVSKTRATCSKHASRPAPHTSPLLSQIEKMNNEFSENKSQRSMSMNIREPASAKPHAAVDGSFRSPFGRNGQDHDNGKSFADIMELESDVSFVSSSGWTSSDRTSSVTCDWNDSYPASMSSDTSSFASMRSRAKLASQASQQELSPVSQNSQNTSFSDSSQFTDELEAEIRRLRMELKQTMDMYNTACKEAITAKQKARELQQRKMEEEQRNEKCKVSEEAAKKVAEKEKIRSQAYKEAAEAVKKVAVLEAQRKAGTEVKTMEDVGDIKRTIDHLSRHDIRYRRYGIEEIEVATEYFAKSRKIGEGGYGPVFQCYLDHTPVAVKVLRPDAAQGRLQFQREVEVLNLIRHPNVILLLGACPEYGILVYEYLAKGSLEDRLFRRGNTPSLSWQLRFRIAAEIATGLLFLHQTKPEPLVHRDLKPANILLDTNYTSKISDVGLARLVPAVAENVTQCRMTSAAGTFCYIDPEYQQTGMLGVKSDVYSLGIILLQLLTGKPPMGLSHKVDTAIENGKFNEILDPTVPDWPVEEAMTFAQLALKCAGLRRKDRPDLGTVVLPELNKLRELAEDKISQVYFAHSGCSSPYYSNTSISQEVMSDHLAGHSGNSKSVSSMESEVEQQEQAGDHKLNQKNTPSVPN